MRCLILAIYHLVLQDHLIRLDTFFCMYRFINYIFIKPLQTCAWTRFNQNTISYDSINQRGAGPFDGAWFYYHHYVGTLYNLKSCRSCARTILIRNLWEFRPQHQPRRGPSFSPSRPKKRVRHQKTQDDRPIAFHGSWCAPITRTPITGGPEAWAGVTLIIRYSLQLLALF